MTSKFWLFRTILILAFVLGLAYVPVQGKEAVLQTGFVDWQAGEKDFLTWQGQGTRLDKAGQLALNPKTVIQEVDPYEVGTYYEGNFYNGGSYWVGEAVSPVIPVSFDFDEMIPSWNAITPTGTWVEILARAFYALHDTKTPVIIGVAAMSLNIGLSFLLSSMFVRWGWLPHGALALANSIATFLEMGVLLFFMRRRLSGLEGLRVLKGLLQALVAGGLMALALWGWMRLTAQWTISRGLSIWVTALGGIAVGGLVYVIALILLRVPEVKMVVGAVNQRLFRRPN